MIYVGGNQFHKLGLWRCKAQHYAQKLTELN
jgi:hypothetical protein